MKPKATNKRLSFLILDELSQLIKSFLLIALVVILFVSFVLACFYCF